MNFKFWQNPAREKKTKGGPFLKKKAFKANLWSSYGSELARGIQLEDVKIE